jgi:pimeloyl-ACP methyl ester carboxylesterase
MTWNPKASIEIANDLVTAALLMDEDSAARGAIEAIAGALITAALEADPTLAANLTEVATTLIEDRIASEQLLRATDARLPQTGAVKSLTVVSATGRLAAKIGDASDGHSFIADLISNRVTVPGIKIVPVADGRLLFMNASGKLSAQIDATGRWTIYDLVGGANAPTPTVVDLVIGLGQSNDEGRGMPISPLIDRPNRRIRMATWDKNGGGTYPTNPLVTGLAEATVPLQSQQSTIGLSINSVIAQRLADTTDDRAVTVVLNAAAGGSGLVADLAQGCWKVGYTGTNPGLYQIAKNAITATLAKITADYPGATIRYWITWLQGEADGSSDPATYATELDALFAGIRAHLAQSTAPIVIGGMVPEYLDTSGKRAIRDQLALAQSRNECVAYVEGVTNGGGSQNVSDRVHYGRAGVQTLGTNMYQGLQRAAVSTTTSVPHKPLTVTAQRVGTTLRIKWSEPETRYTDFVVQYSTDGSTWTTASRATAATRCEENVTGVPTTGSLQVQISTVNGSLTSEPTTPVYAVGV